MPDQPARPMRPSRTGMTAMIRRTAKTATVEAQFDNCQRHYSQDECNGACLTVGWHRFPAAAFEEIDSV